ncbi:hypothetical protein [Microvirga sesbaniae]|nr:hypothetical protein [Microvirga sp. HBU67692]
MRTKAGRLVALSTSSLAAYHGRVARAGCLILHVITGLVPVIPIV